MADIKEFLDKAGLTLYNELIHSEIKSGFASDLSLEMDDEHKITAQLINKNGERIGKQTTIDSPIESVVIDGKYDSDRKTLILTLQNGKTIEIPIGGLISGLQEKIDEEHKLSATLVDGLSEVATSGSYTDLLNKPFTDSESQQLCDFVSAGTETVVSVFWCGINDAEGKTQSEYISGISTGNKSVTGSTEINGTVYSCTQAVQVTTGTTITVTIPESSGSNLHILSTSSSTTARNIDLYKSDDLENPIWTGTTNNVTNVSTENIVENLTEGQYVLKFGTTGKLKGSSNVSLLAIELIKKIKSEKELIEDFLGTTKQEVIDRLNS